MFTRIDPNTVRSTSGFTVQAVRIHDVKYTEAEKSVTISGEILVGDPGYVLYTSTLKRWDPPHNGVMLEGSKRQEIIDNIAQALRFMGVEFVFE